LCWFNSVDETRRDWAVVRLTAGQQNGYEAPLSICECVYLRVAPAGERPTACFCSPLFRQRPSGEPSRA
jgi:hypothetical protein